MKTKKYKVYLTEKERNNLLNVVKKGENSAKKITRANILLYLNENAGKVMEQTQIAQVCRVSTSTIYNVSKQFVKEGLESTLSRKVRETPPVTPIATGEIEARIIALSCSKPPKGYSRWTLRLLEAKTIELGIVESISDNTIGRLLKKRRLSLI